MQRVAPDGICTGIWLRRWTVFLMIKGYHLTFLFKAEVTIHILKGIGTIGARRHTFYHKMTSTVCTRDTHQWFRGKNSVRQIIIESDGDTFYRLQVAGIQHITSNLEGINLLTCREGKGIVTQGVALIIIGNGVTEVDGIGSVLLQCILQFHHNLLAGTLDFRHFQLRRRNNHFLTCIVYFDKLIEIDSNLVRFDISSPVFWRTTYHHRRVVVIPAAIGLSHTGTRDSE